MMTTRIAVLGAGPGGYIAAVRAAQLGAMVTIIEKDFVGGTCLNRGCIPSKIMKTTAEMLDKFNKASDFGISVNTPAMADMKQLMARKQKVIMQQVKGIESLLAHNGVTRVKGNGYISGKERLTVKKADGESIEVGWDKLIIATGSEPATIPALPFDSERIISSNEVLNLETVPSSVVIVGGGVIGCEFASILQALGSKVTIVEALDRLLPLPSVDEDCSKVLQREMKKKKIKFFVNRVVEQVIDKGEVQEIFVGPSPFVENLKEKDKKPFTLEAEKVIVCIGRKPNTGDIGLEAVDVELDDRGWILADDRMQTRDPDIFAIGDVLGPPKIMLAHVASTEGIAAAENAMGNQRKMDYSVVPGAIFTMPEVANVGLTQAEADDAGIEADSDTVLFRTIGKAQAMGEISGQAKIVWEKQSGKVLGVHIVGPHATDLIAEGVLAVQTGTTVNEIARTIHAHPTLAEVMLETAMKASGMAMHG